MTTATAPSPRLLVLRDGTRVCVRPLAPDDEPQFRAGLAQLSSRTRTQRFLSDAKPNDADIHYLTHPDQQNHLALVMHGVDDRGEPTEGIGVARSVRFPDQPDLAEYAVVIADGYQRRGAGGLLLRELAEWGVRTGLRRWYGIMLVDNAAVLAATSRVATLLEKHICEPGVLESWWALPTDYAVVGATV